MESLKVKTEPDPKQVESKSCSEIPKPEQKQFIEDSFARNILSQIEAQHEYTEMRQRQLDLEERKNRRANKKRPGRPKSRPANDDANKSKIDKKQSKKEMKVQVKKEVAVKQEQGIDASDQELFDGINLIGKALHYQSNTSIKVQKLL